MIIIYVLCTRSVITAIWQRERGVWEELMLVTHHVLWLFAGSAPKLPVSSLCSVQAKHTQFLLSLFLRLRLPWGPQSTLPLSGKHLPRRTERPTPETPHDSLTWTEPWLLLKTPLAVGKHLFSSQRNWNVITQTTLENKSKEPKVCEKSFLFCCFDKYFQAQ